MTPQEFDALFAEPASPGTPAPAAPKQPYTREQLDARDKAFLESVAKAPATGTPAPQSNISAAEFDRLLDEVAPLPGTPTATPAAPEVPGLASRIGSDIATGVGELPTAVGGGIRNAAQETGQTIRDASGWQAKVLDPVYGLFGGAPTPDLPKLSELPEFAKPTSVTGGFAQSISQFVTGLVGLGKITKPLEAAAGVLTAGKAVQAAVGAGKAAAVGATAFDPYAPRLADLVESVPGLSNPVSRYLQSDPFDTAAEGRLKNAVESIGMDVVLIGSFTAGLRLFKAGRELQAGKITPAQHQAVVAEAEAADVAANAPKALEPSAGSAAPIPEAPPARDILSLDPQAPGPVQRDVMELGSQPAAPRDVLNLGGKPGAGLEPAASAAPEPRPVSPFASAATPEQTTTILRSLEADTEALARFGSRQSAAEAGHVFGSGDKIPWRQLAITEDAAAGGDALGAFTARLSETFGKELDAAKGGSVLSDARVDATLRARAQLWGEDQAYVAGTIARAGENAATLAVDLRTGFILANRALSDTYAMAARIRLGDLSEWAGDKEAANTALREMLGISTTLFGSAQSMRAGAGRAMRMMRSEFAPSPEVLSKWGALNPDDLVSAIMKTDGDPRALRRLRNVTFLDKVLDASHFLLVNNLLWGPRTSAVNLLGNGYMMVARPAERIIGDTALKMLRLNQGSTVGREARAQFAYFGSSLSDAWRGAVEAWQKGDSVLAPHNVENFKTSLSAANIQFKPHDGLPSLLHNVFLVPAVKVIGTPTRVMGAVDEAAKHFTYRAKVQARAMIEGEEIGLQGRELSDHIANRLSAAFDDSGRAMDQAALQEAHVATFQQELLQGTPERTAQNVLNRHPALRLVVPFLKTPANAMRYGVKLTPGLNMLQGEYRAMMRGEMGPEARAQAAGQMSLGTLYFGYAAWLASSGRITGAGPSDEKSKAALRATGWQPYSYVQTHDDGTRTYTPYGRFDPIALPAGIAADLVDAISNTDAGDTIPEQITAAATAALLGVAKQLSEKSFLKGTADFFEAITEPDPSAGKVVGGIAANMVPLASALRFVNPDPHLREARDMVDKVLATIPGLSATLPARRDMFGDPLSIHKGFTVDGDATFVDAEIRRMASEQDLQLGPPSYSIAAGVDLRDITLKDGKNAYTAYQDFAARPSANARPIKELVGRVMKTPAYARAPDGDAGTRGTKTALITGPMAKYREAALRRIKADPAVREALAEKQMAVSDHYKALAPASKPANRPPVGQELEAMGKAMGVDLSGLGQK